VPHSFEGILQDLVQPHIHFDLFYSALSRKTPISFKDIGQMSAEEQALIQPDLLPCDSPLVTFADEPAALALMMRIIDTWQQNRQLPAKGMLTELIDLLITDNFPQHLSPSPDHTDNLMRQLKAFLDSEQSVFYALEDLEKRFSYSRFYLEKQFKKQYGISLIAYRNQKRLQLACRMLEGNTVSKVAERLGYSSIYAFSRAFKNEFGVSPSAYCNKKAAEPYGSAAQSSLEV